MDNRNLVRDSIKYALPSLPLMYLNFFIDAGARSYSADLTGRFFNAILENQYAAARGLLGGMIAMVLVCTLFLPLWAMLTNALYFSLSLKYDLRVTSAFYSKRYERMRAFETGEVAERIFRDPDDLLTLIAVTPTHLLAQASAYMLMIVFMARPQWPWMPRTTPGHGGRQLERNIEMARVVLCAGRVVLFAARVPLGRVEQIAARQKHIQLKAAEIAHGLKRGALHLDRDAALCPALFKMAPRLAIEGIGRPRLALNAGQAVCTHKTGHEGRVFNGDIVGCGGVVIGCALVAIGRRGHHDAPVRDLPVQAARAAEEDIVLCPDAGQTVLDRGHARRRADIRPVKGEDMALMLKAIDGRLARREPDGRDPLAGIMRGDKALDLVREGDDARIDRHGVFADARIDDGGRTVVKAVGDHGASPP